MSNVQTLHFTVGEDAGKLLMQIAQEHLLYNYDPKKALDTILESLEGCPMELALQLLKGDAVLLVDVEQQMFYVDDEGSNYSDFPKIDVIEWYKRQNDEICKTAMSLNAAIQYASNRIQGRYIHKSYNYNDIIAFINGDNDVILDDLRNTEEVSELALLIKVVKDFIEKSVKIQSVMDWVYKTYSNDFFNKNNKATEWFEYQPMLKDVINNFYDFLHLDYSYQIKDDSLTSFIEVSIKIDETIKKGIEPVNLMDNYSAGWLSPEGQFYGLNGEIANMLHQQIGDALLEIGVIPDDYQTHDNGCAVNPDAWLEQAGWVKIHDNNINFGGCLNYKLSKKNNDLTSIQIRMIKDYINKCHSGLMRLGWKLERVSAARFEMMAEGNIKYLYDNYFEF